MLEDKGLVLKQSHLQVETDLKTVSAILEWFDQFNDGLVQEPLATQCRLVLTECFTVIVRHAHQDLPPTTPIEIELKLFADYLEIRVWERGISFCSLAHLLAHLTDGRRSLSYVPLLIDELCYSRFPDGRNCLVMKKILIKNT